MWNIQLKKLNVMKAFELSIGTVILRFYLMMMIVVVAGFVGQWWLAALALPVFLITILGVCFGKAENTDASIKTLGDRPSVQKKAV